MKARVDEGRKGRGLLAIKTPSTAGTIVGGRERNLPLLVGRMQREKNRAKVMNNKWDEQKKNKKMREQNIPEIRSITQNSTGIPVPGYVIPGTAGSTGTLSLRAC